MKNIITIGMFIACFFLAKAQNEVDKWQKAVSAQQGIAIEWQERTTSLTKKGVKSFVGYYKGNLVATLSVGDKSLSGTFQYRDKSYEISANKGQLVFKQEGALQCGTTDTSHSHLSAQTARPSDFDTEETAPVIANTQALRIYRLAMHIPYSTFSKEFFDSKIEKVRTFWADTENFLNEIYERDLGVHFEVVDDERLVIKDKDNETFTTTHRSDYVMSNSTLVVNRLIGVGSYDVGITIAYTASQKQGTRGLAYLKGVYGTTNKADAVAVPTKQVIAHEIGHLFGAIHTFGSHRGSAAYDSEKTEYNSGTSVMSYGTPRDFFSLSSIQRIRQRLATVPYYKDRERTQLVGTASPNDNIPYGVVFETRAPLIDKTKIKAEYVIPEDTFFQFYLPASDIDSKELLYTANQHDVRMGAETPITQYAIYKPTTANPVSFKKEYNDSGTMVANSWSPDVKQNTGTFTFWLGVNDANPSQSYNYITQYDLVQTKLTVKEGTPFKITTTPRPKYKGGDKLTLAWNVDAAIFKDTKVRVLLSDDLGKTFKHIVVAEAENNGSKQITLPNISTTKAVLKVEVIDRLAFDLTNYHPNNGGFTIEKETTLPEALYWLTQPKDILKPCDIEVPVPTFPKVAGGCNPKVELTANEEVSSTSCAPFKAIRRVFVATDECGQSLTYTQTIQAVDLKAPSFVGDLPKDLTIDEGTAIPAQKKLEATDDCSIINVRTATTEVKDAKGKLTKLIYKWTAKDHCGKTTTHQQTITIVPKTESPTLTWAILPENATVDCAKAIPAVQTPTTQGGCAEVQITRTDKELNKLCANNFTLERIFTATDGCTTITYTQRITVADTTPPTFVGELPQDLTIDEGEPIPAQKKLEATDACSAVAVSTATTEVKDAKGKLAKLIYTWVAQDVCGKTTTHQQTITMVPKTESPTLTWAILPENATVDCAKAIPVVQTPTTQGGCAEVQITRTDKELNKLCANNFTLERIFTATDGCTTITYTQRITVADTTPPTFLGELPQDLTIEEGTPIPSQKSISVEDTCSGAPTVMMPPRVEYLTDGKLSKIVYKWVARDICGNQRVHTQTIVVKPKSQEPRQIEPHRDEVVVYNAVSTGNGSDNYFKIENADEDLPITLVVFDEMGLKVYESNYYQQNGEYFRGYPNVRGVVGNKRLAGTYFYVVTYYFKGQQEVKKGFLYVK